MNATAFEYSIDAPVIYPLAYPMSAVVHLLHLQKQSPDKIHQNLLPHSDYNRQSLSSALRSSLSTLLSHDDEICYKFGIEEACVRHCPHHFSEIVLCAAVFEGAVPQT